jgi:hypothetical protein
VKTLPPKVHVPVAVLKGLSNEAIVAQLTFHEDLAFLVEPDVGAQISAFKKADCPTRLHSSGAQLVAFRTIVAVFDSSMMFAFDIRLGRFEVGLVKFS